MTDKVEKEEKIEEYDQILELFGEKVEEIDFEDVKSVYIRNSVFTDNAKKVENMTSEEKDKPLSRRKLREEAFKIIFSMEFLEVDDNKVDIYCNINGIGNNEDNECINICKKYSEEKNTKFINGILANYIKIKGIK